jgi:hypothetical protein
MMLGSSIPWADGFLFLTGQRVQAKAGKEEDCKIIKQRSARKAVSNALEPHLNKN